MQEAQAIANEKQGLAEANIIRAKGEAEAGVIEQQGDAKAKAERELGMVQAAVTREQFRAEADGLTEKFAAMDAISAESRAHEEYRMKLDNALKETLAAIAAGQEIAQENARILAIALEKAKIDIVGGEQHFFDTFAKSLSLGKSIDGLIGKSEVASQAIQQLLGSKLLSENTEKH